LSRDKEQDARKSVVIWGI